MNFPSSDDIEKSIGFTEISDREEFENMLKLDCAIIYILVDWSGPERISRYAVYKAIHELDRKQIPLYRINCSAQGNNYSEEWLTKQKEAHRNFCYGGYGETLLIVRGKVLDFIGNPGKEKPDHITEKLNEWIALCDNHEK